MYLLLIISVRFIIYFTSHSQNKQWYPIGLDPEKVCLQPDGNDYIIDMTIWF